ncbi:YHS domain-containing (seleno)protein [Roseomonas fluvialis]|nr:YHS domain-containing (seleno)protein [Roseomonas fluvialis]
MSNFASRRALAKGTLGAGLIGAAALVAARPAAAGNQLAVAISGYDATSFFTGTPRPGVPRFNATHNGAIWYFTTEAARDQFRASPARFAPQYDGYCAWAASQGYKAPGNPDFWRVVDDRLYLKVHEQAQAMWVRDIPGNITKANMNWPRIHPF